MSKTDNTRPWEVQARDLTEEGYVAHSCTKARGRSQSKGRNHKTPSSVSVSVSLADWQQSYKRAKLVMELKWPQERDGRVYFSVTRRHNTTTAKVMARLRMLFGDVTEQPKPKRIWATRIILDCKEGETCDRVLRHIGGERYLGGAAGYECNFRRRRIRRRERAALHKVLAGVAEDFELLPTRNDKKTIHYDLT